MGKPLLKKTLVAPLASLMDDRLSYRERAVLLALYSFHGTNGEPVYPDREQLALRSGIKSLNRVSNITTALMRYGWLSKRKLGWTGRNNYFLSIPLYMYWTSFGEVLITLSSHLPNNVTVTKNVTSIVTKVGTSSVTDEVTINKQTTLTNHINKPHMNESALFNIFYDQYPKQVGRKKAYNTWIALKPDRHDLDAMLINISDRLTQGDWSLDAKKYIPHPSNYLEGEQWKDELIRRITHDKNSKLTPVERVRAAIASGKSGTSRRFKSGSFLPNDG